MKRETIALRTGASSTGTPHGLLLERESDSQVRFTVVGHDGKKRHAAVILSNVEATQLLEALSAAVGDR
jgi:hypothetical protein